MIFNSFEKKNTVINIIISNSQLFQDIKFNSNINNNLLNLFSIKILYMQ